MLYVDAVKQVVSSGGCSSHVAVTEAVALKDKDQGNPISALASEGGSDANLTEPLTKESIDAVEPYIPSYLAALKSCKSCKSTVTLEGVPIKLGRKQDTWCSSTNVSSSLLEPDTASSWADDDEDFLLTIARSQQQKRVEMQTALPYQATGNGRKGGNMNDLYGNQPQQAIKQTMGEEEDGNHHDYHEKKGRGWRKVENGVSSGGNAKKNRGRQGGGRQGSNTTQNNGGNTTSNPAFLSGGRFDVLANVKIMRHR